MRLAIVRYCRAAGGHGALVQRPSTHVAQKGANNSVGKASALGELQAGISGDLGNVASRAESVSRKVFKGSGSGTAYAADSPVLSRVLNTPPPSVEPCQKTASPKPVVAHHSPTTELSLSDLKRLPSAELQRMLAQRGLGRSSAADKDELATWVYQHQELPVTNPGAPTPQRHVKSKQSLSELQQRSVAELRSMLAARGVPEGSATEKGDLARWVWQHQDLPIIYSPEDRRSGHQRRSQGFGSEGQGKSRDYSEHRKDEERKALEAPEDVARLEGDSAKLLESGTVVEPSRGRWWMWAVAGVAAAFALAIGVVAVSDAHRATQLRDDDS